RPLGRVSKDGRSQSWFETAQERLLTMRELGASIELDAGLADQFRPVLIFGPDKGIELVVRQIPHLAAALLKTLLQIGQRGADPAAQFCDDFGRGLCRR